MSSALTGSVLARRSYFDLLANRAFEHQAAYPYTFDLSAGMTFNLGKRSTLSLKALHATEGMKMTTNALEPISADENSKIDLYSIAYENRISERTSEIIRLGFYEEKFDYKAYWQDVVETVLYGEYGAKMKAFSFREDFSHQISDNYRIQRGISFSHINSDMYFIPNTETLTFVRRVIPPLVRFDRQYMTAASYVDYAARLSPRLETNVGVRYDYSQLIEQGNLGPRANILFKAFKDISGIPSGANATNIPTSVSSLTGTSRLT